MKDAISAKRLEQLHPKAKGIFKAFIEECEDTFGITLRISQGLRTIAGQDALYAQGRTSSGHIVTNAKGGSSFHNYGLAVDLVEMDHNGAEANWKYDMATLVPIAKKHGEQWGGDWIHIKDYPHFQLSFGYTWQQLFEKYQNKDVDKSGYVNL